MCAHKEGLITPESRNKQGTQCKDHKENNIAVKKAMNLPYFSQILKLKTSFTDILILITLQNLKDTSGIGLVKDYSYSRSSTFNLPFLLSDLSILFCKS